MPRLAANLSMLFTELPFLERFAAAAEVGFQGVECQFPYDHSAEAVAEQLQQHHLQQVLFNAPPGNWAMGERGIAALPGREREFQDSIGIALHYAQILDCPTIHIMAGLVPSGSERADLEVTYVQNLRYAATQAAELQRQVVIEAINPLDMPGYFLNRQADARRLIQLANVPTANLMVQLDFYHCQRVEGSLTDHLIAQLPLLGHVQIAGVPGRHEPDHSEMDSGFLLAQLDAHGYSGWVGCEYHPRGETRSGLGWAAPYGITPQES